MTAAGADPDTLFEIGSITKVLTATLVLQHVAARAVGLDDPVVGHLPSFRLDPPELTGSVTIRQLLTHTSGIDRADDFTDTGDGDDCLERYVADVVAGAPVLHSPGGRWSYNNAGFTVLGHLVEVLDGRPWDDALAARIIDPLGLAATTTARLGPRRPIASGHRLDPSTGRVVDEPGRMPRSAGPAGNVVATVTDLLAFTRALFAGGGELLPPDLVNEMVRPQIDVRDGGAQGLGWALPVAGLAAHGGTTRGSTAFLGAVPGVGALAVVANGPGAGAIAAEAQAHLFGAPVDRAPRRGPGPDVEPTSCTGRYERHQVAVDVGIDQTAGHLVATTTFAPALADLFPSPPPVRLDPLGGGRFTSRQPFEDADTVWDFTDAGANGVPSGLLTTRLHRRVDG